MTEFTVRAERCGKWWVLQADEAPGAITQVKKLSEAGEIIESIAFVTDLPEDEISIAVAPKHPATTR